MKSLVIVESPAKVKTISKYLGVDYQVAASMGHVVDLPKSDLGVDEKTFDPKYVTSNQKSLSNLKKLWEGKTTLVIASDPDREGESIGWHVAQKLKVIDKKGKLKDKEKRIIRVSFSSITKEAVNEAIKNPRTIDMNLVNAQQARRVLDRLVGYKLSPLLWKKIRFGLSAGRVQSVAVKLIVDKEDERDKFNPVEFWVIEADVSKSGKDRTQIISSEKKFSNNQPKVDNLLNEEIYEFQGTKFELVKISGKKADLENKKEVEKILGNLDKKNKAIISKIEHKKSYRNPKAPFTTSTLQQTAANMYGFTSKRTMSVAQKLYEAGHITYMRTDSMHIVPTEVKKMRDYIVKDFGQKYISAKENYFSTKSKNAQEAHEAIRSTNPSKHSSDLKLTEEQAKLYDLIGGRALATQMIPAELSVEDVHMDIGEVTFLASGQRVVFDGYLKVYPERVSENKLEKFEENQQVSVETIHLNQKFTKPPARYTEATLIKTLEKFGIGRPSTYASIISTIQSRQYVVKEAKYFIPTDTGKVVTRLLDKYFHEIVNTDFTAKLENDLDEIAEGKIEWKESISEFYGPFLKKIVSGDKKIERDEFTVLGKSDFKCPVCGKKMVKKLGRYGAFVSCENFPKCLGMRGMDGKTEEERQKETEKQALTEEFTTKYEPAPISSEDGVKLLLKQGRYGMFWAHPNYPKVKEAKPLLLKEKCPLSGHSLTERKGKWGKSFIGCSNYPDCKYIKKAEGAEVKSKTKAKKRK